MYSKILVFTEEDNRGRIPVNKLEQAVAKALSSFYLFAGRLSPQPRGRYAIQDFEKGCLFQVCESSDSLQEYKKNHFGYKNVPASDFMPIHNFTSFDSPLVAIQLTQLQGGQALGYSFSHRIADSIAVCYFLKTVAQYMRNEAPSVELYYDWQRPPVQPSHRYDHSIEYPVVHEIQQEVPDRWKLDDASAIRRVFCISESKAKELKYHLELELTDKDATISLRDAIAALFHQSIVKARRIKGRCDLLYVVSKRRQHPDKRLMNHFGNYFVPVIVPETHDTLMRRSLASSAVRVHEAVDEVNPEYMDSLEHYLNTLEDPSKVRPPVHRMTPGCIVWSDWSRFEFSHDMGYGRHCTVTRSSVDPVPMAVVTMTPKWEGAYEVVVQMDPKSMERMVNDKQVQYYTLGVF
ncbi:hypothetical protein K492DRAFT_175749 [Lichtheimia hyalospora FSU 10163]|nr:hypothetical protein K492DRAFT_175749 [Lichtheimia hyalospora FSU 10163]